MTPTLCCPICARQFRTALFYDMHMQSFHQPAPNPVQQQFERMVRDQRDRVQQAGRDTAQDAR